MAKDKGTVLIHGKEYTTVAKRVHDFRTENKLTYSIETELVERTEVDVVMKALIKEVESGKIIATGYAEEKRTSSAINRTSALENCETSAIGRALAAFGSAGTEYASADEVANSINQQNPDKRDNPAFERQSREIRAISVQLGYSDDVINKRLSSISSSDEAIELIKNLNELLYEKEQKEKGEPF